MRVDFYLRFHTKINQILYITGNHDLLGDYEVENALQLEYFNNDFWRVTIEVDEKKTPVLRYKYLLKNGEDEWIPESENTRIIHFPKSSTGITLVDTWNHAGDYENVFYTAP